MCHWSVAGSSTTSTPGRSAGGVGGRGGLLQAFDVPQHLLLAGGMPGERGLGERHRPVGRQPGRRQGADRFPALVGHQPVAVARGVGGGEQHALRVGQGGVPVAAGEQTAFAGRLPGGGDVAGLCQCLRPGGVQRPGNDHPALPQPNDDL